GGRGGERPAGRHAEVRREPGRQGRAGAAQVFGVRVHPVPPAPVAAAEAAPGLGDVLAGLVVAGGGARHPDPAALAAFEPGPARVGADRALADVVAGGEVGHDRVDRGLAAGPLDLPDDHLPDAQVLLAAPAGQAVLVPVDPQEPVVGGELVADADEAVVLAHAFLDLLGRHGPL